MIDSYNFGRMEIDGVVYTSDVIIFPGRVKESWWRKDGHSLCPADLETVFAAGPEILVVGCGYSGALKIPESTRRAIVEKGIELRAAKSAEAVKIFNEVFGGGGVVGAFHLTC